MVPEDILNLVRQLTEATTKGLAHWVPAVETQIPDPGERNDFVLTMPDYSVNVNKEPTDNIGLSILGKTGHALMYFQSSPDEAEYPTFEALLTAASWKAAKIDLILADVDRALKGGGILGQPRGEDEDDS